MLTLFFSKEYVGKGKSKRIARFKICSLKSTYVNSYTWHLLFENGKVTDLLLASRGKDQFLKKDIRVSYSERIERGKG